MHHTNGHAEHAQEVVNGHTKGDHNAAKESSDGNITIARNDANGVQSNGTYSPSRLLVFSAKSETSAISYLSTFKEYLETKSDLSESIDDLSYTLGQRRTHFSHHFAAVASSVTDLQAQLATSNISRIQEHSVIFAFTGQGAQYICTVLQL